VISDGNRLYLTGTSGIRAFEHQSRKEALRAKRNNRKDSKKKQDKGGGD